MMTTQPPHPEGTRAGAWAPDWQAIDAAALDDPEVRRLFGDPATYDQGAQLHDERRTAELQRQAAAAGWVLVTCEDLEIAAEYLCFAASVWHGRGRPEVAKPITELRLRFEGMLAAARQEDPTDANG